MWSTWKYFRSLVSVDFNMLCNFQTFPNYSLSCIDHGGFQSNTLYNSNLFLLLLDGLKQFKINNILCARELGAITGHQVKLDWKFKSIDYLRCNIQEQAQYEFVVDCKRDKLAFVEFGRSLSHYDAKSNSPNQKRYFHCNIKNALLVKQKYNVTLVEMKS